MRTAFGVAGLAVTLVAAGVQAAGAGEGDHSRTGPVEYVVLYSDVASPSAARRAVEAAGGEIVSENAAIGTALVRTDAGDFAAAVRRGGAVLGAARNRAIGQAPDLAPARELVERLTPGERQAALRAARAAPSGEAATGPRLSPAEAPALIQEPLASRQWDMAMIGATPTGSYATEPGDRRVRVGVIDTGIDGRHPDIAPNFDAAASRNFTTDIPEVDGPCEVETCIDPADVDHDGHGTHVASTIASPVNGLGVAGVAPNVTLVNVRAGQDSGFFFLQPTLEALKYAADAKLDVVNMSFYVDPWLYNCAANAADSPAAQNEQRTIVTAVQRAVDYARSQGVTLFGALGNEATDLGQPVLDETSPDYPKGSEYDRRVDNTCITVPAETEGVLSVASVGPSGRKANYSNYGLEQTDLAAPGGDAYDTPDNGLDPKAMILAAWPENVARADGDLDGAGRATTPFLVEDCSGDTCAYYRYLQGTSMAAPHAAGVAALAVSRFGSVAPDGDIGLDPRLTTLFLWVTADRRRCPSPATYTYVLDRAGGKETFTHTCEESFTRNGFYGHGIVNAATLARLPRFPGDPSSTAPPAPREPAPQSPPAQSPPAPQDPPAGQAPPGGGTPDPGDAPEPPEPPEPPDGVTRR